MRDRILLLLIGLVIATLIGSGGVLIQTYERAVARITALEAEVDMLTRALISSNALNDETRTAIQELGNRAVVREKSQDELLTAAVARATPAVVSIVVKKDVPLLEVVYVNPFGNDPFFGDVGFRVPTYRQVGTEKKQVGAGTGFIVRTDGYIVTNKHVVQDTGAEYVVLLSTGEQKAASVIYRDPAQDLALLQIEGSGYPVLALGNSGALQLGQTVAVIGNALGEYSNSVSVGIISGLNRTIEATDDTGRTETLAGIIQTDAAINPGNSGGPMIDLTGSAVGVSVATNRGADNVSFALPIQEVRALLDRAL